jgi:putative hemolysin
VSSIQFEIVVILLLLIANGIFAMSEIAVVTARKSRLQEWASQGMGKARAVLELANQPNQFLSTVQIGITMVGILAGAFGGGTLTEWLAAQLSAIPFMASYSRSLALGAVVLAITYCSLIIGELVPKRLALGHPESIAMFMAPTMRLLLKVCAPVVRLLSASTDLVFRLFGKRFEEQSSVTEEEVRTLIRQGTQAGVFEETEQDMVEAVFQFGDMSARGLMTPRTQIVWLDVNDSIEQIRAKLTDSGHSRFPVCVKSLDEVLGVVHAKDILATFLLGKSIDLRETMQQPTFVPRSMSALQVLDNIKNSGSHMVLVVDEYGGIEGLLTHHDLLEAIAGDMPLGKAPAQPKAVQRKDGSWLLDGMMSVDEFKEIFQLKSLPGEKRDTFQTLGGFLFTQLGHVPSVTEQYEWTHLRFEVVDMDGKRIDKVLVTSAQSLAANQQAKGG